MSRRFSPSTHVLAPRPLFLAMALLLGAPLAAQSSYTLVDLTPTGAGVASATGLGLTGGWYAATPSTVPGRAAWWTPTGMVDFHPSFLDDPIQGLQGRSAINGFSNGLQVGWGAGPATKYRAAAMIWRDTPESASLLNLPFPTYASQAVNTDGNQIVGFATPYVKDGNTLGPVRAMVWDAATGAAVDLGDGGNGAEALAVGRGMQVGYVLRNAPNAAVWTGSAKSLIVIHPKNAVGSRVEGTDGIRQVGWSSYQVRIRVEAPRGTKDVLRAFATVWTGANLNTATLLHPYPVNNPAVTFTESFATAVSGGTIVGYAREDAAFGTQAYHHAIIWDASFRAIDLNAYLPTGFVGSQAFSVDAQGTVAGVMVAPDGHRHAVLWVPNP